MIDGIRRVFHILFGSPQPIEWWLLGADLAIVGLIIWLDVPKYLHKKKCGKIVGQLQPLSVKGIQLQMSTPNPRTAQGAKAFQRWQSEVNAWSDQTQELLTRNSPKAASAFMLVINAQVADQTVRSTDGNVFSLRGGSGDTYQIFQLKLSNLQTIMQNPEAYF